MTASRSLPTLMVASLVALAGSIVLAQSQPAKPSGQEDGFKFRTGVELINVTATVTDATGRFVSGLQQEDFVVYEDDVRQEVTHFSAERVPVSLGLVIDTSGSMAGEKWEHAAEALDRFLLDLLVEQDEVFLYRFSNDPDTRQDWTTDRARLSRAMRRIVPRGGTAMYDALAEAVPLADSGHNRKKAIVVISDGNDTNSRTGVPELKQLIRETEVMVYAVGIDGDDRFTTNGPEQPAPRADPISVAEPGSRRRPWPGQPPSGPSGGGGRGGSSQNDHVNAAALRELTDDTGGRTEIVRSSRDLDPATTNIADELSKQYFLAYPTNAHKDGQWHTIRVDVRDGRYHVRARRGYVGELVAVSSSSSFVLRPSSLIRFPRVSPGRSRGALRGWQPRRPAGGLAPAAAACRNTLAARASTGELCRRRAARRRARRDAAGSHRDGAGARACSARCSAASCCSSSSRSCCSGATAIPTAARCTAPPAPWCSSAARCTTSSTAP